MNKELLVRLSDADGIAADEDEVRAILHSELDPIADRSVSDNIGSIGFEFTGKAKDKIKILILAHMDEVGFIVRSISSSGLVYLACVGGVLDTAKDNQKVRVTTSNNGKYKGLLNTVRDANHQVKDMYVDFGFDCEDEVRAAGIEEGNMVCFDTDCCVLEEQDKVMGKALDDRVGCYCICELAKMLKQGCNNDVVVAGTSSEEVGTRGGSTMAHLVDPDLIIAVDVASHPVLDTSFKNHRKLGNGPMVVFYDKTLSPNRKLIRYVRNRFDQNGISYQNDMLKGGGTDCGSAHLENNGYLAFVLGIALRCCHGPVSFASLNDLDTCCDGLFEICNNTTKSDINEFLNF